jgi:hypothetical protein
MNVHSGSKWSLRITRRIPRIVGRLNRVLVRIPVVGETIASTNASLAGKILPSVSALGFQPSDSFEGAVANWENFLWRIGADFDRREESGSEIVYTFHSCPAGFTEPRHLRACKATMQLDHRLVEASGAQLVVECRIPEDGICVERLRSRT